MVQKKQIINTIVVLTIVLAILSCSSRSTDEKSIDSNPQKTEITGEDSILIYYTALIKKHYSDSVQEGQKIDLDVEGVRAFENDSILILSFSEIIKFGSYRYNNSSLFLYKEGNQFQAVEPFMILNKDLPDASEEIWYPNRIPGEFKEAIDLTGDGIPEYLFLNSKTFKDNIEQEVAIYKLDIQQNKLIQLNIESD